jgi:cytochrome P450
MRGSGRERAMSVHEEQHFDHHAPDHVATMRSRFAELRNTCPVAHSDAYGGFWILSRHHDVISALKANRTFSSASGVMIPSSPYPLRSVPTESDEPEHSHYRRVLWPFLTPAAVRAYEPLVRQTVTELIDGFIESGQADVMEQLAKPVPAQVTGQFFGFTVEEGRHIYDLKDTALRASSMGNLTRAQTASRELFDILQASLDTARQEPGDDVSSAIVTYDHEGKTFTNDECLGILNTAIGGALATTAGAIGHAIHLLWKYPEQRRRLVENPDLAASAVEEVLRMESPAHAGGRTVKESNEVEGVTLQPGDRVLLLFDSANYDESVFDEPDVLKVDRPNNPHVSFGHGIHKCEGQHLARLELRIVLEEFVRRIPVYEVTGTPIISGGAVLTPVDLHISFPPGARSTTGWGYPVNAPRVPKDVHKRRKEKPWKP